MTAGYSGTPLAKKLGIGDGSRVALIAAPHGFEAFLRETAPGAAFLRAEGESADVIVLFATDPRSLAEALPAAKARLDFAGGLWVAWPKKQKGLETALSENLVREFGLAAGLVDNKVCAIDERWSGLRFVYRKADRPSLRGRAGTRSARNP